MAQFYFTKPALPHLENGGSIVNNASVNAHRGSPQLVDYSAPKGAIVAFTRSLALAVVEKRRAGERRRARSDLDAPDSGDVSAG